MPHRAALGVVALVVGSVAPWWLAVPAEAGVVEAAAPVHVLTPGANPRSVLRLKPDTAPTRRTLTFSTQLSQSGASSQQVGPLQIQAVIATAQSSVAPGGTIRVPYSYESFQLLGTSVGSPSQLDAVRTSLTQFQGLRGQFTLSSTGAVLSNSFKIPSTVSGTARSVLQQLSDQSSQLSVPLPTQAVGVGAGWETTTQLTVSGIKFTQKYGYTLRARDGTRLTLDVTSLQTAPRQRVNSPGLPSGASVTVISSRVTGTGTTVVDLSQVTPVSGHLVARGLQVFRVQQGSLQETLNQQLELGIDVAAG